MAQWKKMAEAFGRAVYGKNNANKVAKVARHSFERDLDNYDNPAANKRAEAFFKGGELAAMDSRKLAETGGVDKKLYEAFDADYARSYGPERAYQKALDDTGLRGEAPSSIGEFEETFGYDIEEGSPNRFSDKFDRMTDERTDKALEEEFDKEFNSAINRRRNDVRDEMSGTGMEDEAADTFRDELWKTVTELRDRGMSGNDILDMLRWR